MIQDLILPPFEDKSIEIREPRGTSQYVEWELPNFVLPAKTSFVYRRNDQNYRIAHVVIAKDGSWTYRILNKDEVSSDQISFLNNRYGLSLNENTLHEYSSVMELTENSLLPMVVSLGTSPNGEVGEVITCSSIAGGNRYLDDMPADLELTRHNVSNGQAARMSYVSEALVQRGMICNPGKKMVFTPVIKARDKSAHPHGWGFPLPTVDFPDDMDPSDCVKICMEYFTNEDFICEGATQSERLTYIQGNLVNDDVIGDVSDIFNKERPTAYIPYRKPMSLTDKTMYGLDELGQFPQLKGGPLMWAESPSQWKSPYHIFDRKKLSPSEALYGFCGWLVSRKVLIDTVSQTEQLTALVLEYCEKNELEFPRDGFTNYLKTPVGDDFSIKSEQNTEWDDNLKPSEAVLGFGAWIISGGSGLKGLNFSPNELLFTMNNFCRINDLVRPREGFGNLLMTTGDTGGMLDDYPETKGMRKRIVYPTFERSKGVSISAEFAAVINKYSLENITDTPDWILADFIMNMMEALSPVVGTNDPVRTSKFILSCHKALEKLESKRRVFYDGKVDLGLDSVDVFTKMPEEGVHSFFDSAIPGKSYRVSFFKDINGQLIKEGDIIRADGYGSLNAEDLHCVEFYKGFFGSDIYGDWESLNAYKNIEVLGHCEDFRDVYEKGMCSGNIGSVIKHP